MMQLNMQRQLAQSAQTQLKGLPRALPQALPNRVHRLSSLKPVNERAISVLARVAAPEQPATSTEEDKSAPVAPAPQPQPTAGANIVYKSWQDEPQGKITGPTVVITGGSQGVGRALACQSAKAGYNVIIASRSPTTLEEAGKAAFGSNTGVKKPAVLAVSVDITDESAVKGLAITAGELFEDISVLYNNAGVCATGLVEDTPIDATRYMMEINFIGHMVMTQQMLPYLKESAMRAKTRQGAPGRNVPMPAIVFVNSFAARIPLKNMSIYTASKYALVGFTDVLRDELRSSGIFVGTVNPGVIKSNFLERAQWFGKQGDFARDTMGSAWEQAGFVLQTPEEVANEAFNCAKIQTLTEINVGPAFNGMVQGYRLTGFNPFALAP